MPAALRIYPVLALMAACFYSYIPFIYVLNYAGISKAGAFIGLILLCIMLFFARLALFAENGSFQKLTPVVLYLPFSVYALWSYSLTIDHMNDSQNIFVLAFLNLLFLAMGTFAAADKERVFDTLYVLAFVYVMAVGLQLAEGTLNLTQSGFYSVFTGVASNGATAYQNTSSYLGIVSLLSLMRCSGRTSLARVVYALAFCVASFMMLVIGGRAAIVSAAVVLFFWLNVGESSWKILRRTVFFSALLVLCIVLFSVGGESWLGVDITKLVGVRRLQGLAESGDPSSRIFLFTKAVELFSLSLKTVFFGAGINSFPVYTGSFSLGLYPHNIVLELLAEFGLVGFFLFCLPLARILFLRRKVLGSVFGGAKSEQSAMMVFAFLFLQSNGTGGLRSSWLLVFFLGLLYPRSRAHEEKKADLSSQTVYPQTISGIKKIPLTDGF